jgi:hypothetical protein
MWIFKVRVRANDGAGNVCRAKCVCVPMTGREMSVGPDLATVERAPHLGARRRRLCRGPSGQSSPRQVQGLGIRV